ncbi:putative bifunctional diguanylate cyclase/phosphodiesterase [Terriglobus roseus]|uniref:Diguanylate cyclase (GGDEF) domain-containing protein n=1 Tax=Terriglobus roseus TaxID=392734 RepID=A0A1G7PDM9_9BACT|nr:EAL domain-containing protein [Terriglobus roseus]SDF83739.1 diguanylate cyclase (GGDEF) domain-containing protein [Terriglobus roseus]
MYPAFEIQGLQLTMAHQPQGVAAGFLLMLLTMFSAFRFAEALTSVDERRRNLWTIGAAIIAGYGRFSVQLCFLSLFQVPQSTSFDLSLFALALLVTVLGRTIAFRSVIRENIRMRMLLPSSLLEASTILFSQQLLLVASHVRYPSRPMSVAATFFLAIALCFLSQIIVASLLRRTASRRGTRFAYPIISVMSSALVTYLIWTWAKHAPPPQHIVLDTASMQLQSSPFIVPIAIGIAVLILCGTDAGLFLYSRSVRWSRGLAEAEQEKEIAKALAEQRAMRMQNEALLEEIRERKRAEAKLAAFAFSDPVTGLNNRSYLNDRLRTLLQKKVARGYSYHALLYIDLDNFKSANDMLGHAQGDSLLKEVATRLRTLATNDDVPVRIGGDEFAMLVNCASDAECAMRFARQVLTILERPFEFAGNSLHLSASVGLCTIDSSYTDPDSVLRDADLAMYCSKREGGARVTVFAQEMYSNMLRAIEDRKELKRAIAEEEFVLWYQPLVDMKDGSIYGSEALIRWQHPVRGLLGPYTFIRLAEETGHIIEIGNWVLRKACSDFHKFQEKSSRPLLLSLNVSSKQLELPGYFDLLTRTLQETGMPPDHLQLEITESILMSEPALMGPLLQRIRALGIKIAFDDFGTGYSSLSYIQKFPVDTLKIDQSFVRSVVDSSVNGKIIQFIMGMSEALGMSVSVEGVETEFEATTLLGFGCRIAQGFLYSRPVERETFFGLLKRKSLIPSEVIRIPAA